MKTKPKLKATCIWCRKVSEPYPIHIECWEMLEVYNTMLRIYQKEYPRGWIDFLNLRTKRAATLEKDTTKKEFLMDIAKAGEEHRKLLDDPFWEKHWPERQRNKK